MLNVLKYNPLFITLFLLSNILNIYIINKNIIKLFEIKEAKEFRTFIILSITSITSMIFIPFEISYLLNLIIQIYLYKKILKLNFEQLCISISMIFAVKTFSQIFLPIFENQILGIFIVELIINLVIFAIIKYRKLKLNISENLNEKSKKILILIATISLISIYCAEIKIINDINKMPIYIFCIFEIMITLYLIFFAKTIIEMLKENDARIKIENLEGSNKRLQENYDNVRAFKHDFNNIMQGFGGLILAKDLEGLNKMYKSIINECQEINDKQSINEDIINNPAILNLINNKIKLAEQNDIKIKLEVYLDLNSLKISTYDLCRILGILIDNAIEASIGCDEKIITIKFLKDKFNNRSLIVIENPYKNYLIDIKKIYEKGFSSKKDKISHGLGLWKIKQILKKNKNIQIYTSRDKLFKQQLEIY